MKVIKFLFFIIFINIATASNFIKIELPKGLSIKIPINWEIISENRRITLNSFAESITNSLEFRYESDMPFAANLYDDYGKTIAIVNIRYYPNAEITQSDALLAPEEDIRNLDKSLHQQISLSVEQLGSTISSWMGTSREEINGIIVFITEYIRSTPNRPAFRVRLVRAFMRERSFTLTVSHELLLNQILEPITDKIIHSIIME